MADAETDISAQVRTTTSATASCTTSSPKCTTVPASVIQAVNKSSDLVPALFALPCNSGDTKKLKLCKRVGWLRDGVFTTGYMEINTKEAKQKGIFKTPRRVTLVRREDSAFQSTTVGTSTKPPTGDQLSSVMLKRNTSTTAVIDLKGELVPNTILVEKGSLVFDEGTTGKLVALNSHDPPPIVGASDAIVDSDDTQSKEAVSEASRMEDQNLCGDSLERDTVVRNCENNNTSKPSSDSLKPERGQLRQIPQKAPTASADTAEDRLSVPEYFLTEEGEASPVGRRSASEPNQDFQATPAVRALKHLVNVADVNRKARYSKNGEPSAGTEQQVHTKSHITCNSNGPVLRSLRASLSSEKSPASSSIKLRDAQPSKRRSLNETVDFLFKELKIANTGKLNPTCSVIKLDIDFSSKDAVEEAVRQSTAKTSVVTTPCVPKEHLNLLDKRTQLQTPPSRNTVATNSSSSSSFDSAERTLQPPTKTCEAVSDHSVVLVSSEGATALYQAPAKTVHPSGPSVSSIRDLATISTGDKPPSQHFPSSSENTRETCLNIDSVSVSKSAQRQTEEQNPLQTPSQAKQVSTVDHITVPNGSPTAPTSCASSELTRRTGPRSPSSEVGSENHSSETPTQAAPASESPANVPQTPVNVAVESTIPTDLDNGSPFKNSLDGFPTLQIGSVYSLSEKEAKELFPDPKPSQPNKSVLSTQEADDRDTGIPSTNFGVTGKEEFTDASHLQGINLGSQIQPTKTASFSNQNVSTFPFVSNPNVKLYNITPSKASSNKKTICTPVTAVVPSPPANVLPTNIVVSVPAAPGLINVQQPVYRAAGQLYKLVPSTQAAAVPNQSQLVSLVPVHIGALQRTTVSTSPSVPVPTSSIAQVVSSAPAQFPIRPSTSAATLPLKRPNPAVLNLPIVAQSCSGDKRIVITRVRKEASHRPQSTPTNHVSGADGVSKVAPLSSGIVTPGSGRTISSPGLATSPLTPKIVASSADSVTAKKTIVTRKDTVVPIAKAVTTKHSESGLELKSPQRGFSPGIDAPRKTFLITTSNGEKRLVSLPANADAATVLSKMASNKAYQFVLPQKATVKKADGEKGSCEELKSSESTVIQSPKKPEKSPDKPAHKPAHKIKKKQPILKIKFSKEPEVDPDVRRSTREKKIKRPYSPPREAPRRAKVSRPETPSVTDDEANQSLDVQDTDGSPLPFIKTEPGSPDPEPTYWDDVTAEEDSLPPQLPCPPSYFDRQDRVKRLKALMKEKEKALEEMLERRKQELEERLADPELADL
ncbi:nascent polypeptide-associated complex subunit alpha, muscle-specific form-like [Acanthaster planci]|uniref:Nascent polypeptide-associated complex subunit alpha, muscle-specific form-like n=1 Tax=Acanthaster planci TaxID=133434 RepID=A0A8B7ZCF9_ACAPL|nr:nascent polypeptide-associated complex subunit alpha, muscle-specific form-like [Acanthaster planci]